MAGHKPAGSHCSRSTMRCAVYILTLVYYVGRHLVSASSVPESAEPLPQWPTQFSVEFNETTTFLSAQWHTSGKWWYDAQQGVEMIFRKDGRGDRYCVWQHPLKSTPCIHLVKDGIRYLIYPELQQCCICCTAAGGCGVLSSHWLDAAKFEEATELYGMPVYKWNVQGLQPNYYYATADDAQLPVEIDQVGTDYQMLHTGTFTPGPIDPGLFSVPSYCKRRCSLLSVCSLLS